MTACTANEAKLHAWQGVHIHVLCKLASPAPERRAGGRCWSTACQPRRCRSPGRCCGLLALSGLHTAFWSTSAPPQAVGMLARGRSSSRRLRCGHSRRAPSCLFQEDMLSTLYLCVNDMIKREILLPKSLSVFYACRLTSANARQHGVTGHEQVWFRNNSDQRFMLALFIDPVVGAEPVQTKRALCAAQQERSVLMCTQCCSTN